MIVYLRTVVVPTEWRKRYMAWIDAGRQTRQQHGILAELVCDASMSGRSARRPVFATPVRGPVRLQAEQQAPRLRLVVVWLEGVPDVVVGDR